MSKIKKLERERIAVRVGERLAEQAANDYTLKRLMLIHFAYYNRGIANQDLSQFKVYIDLMNQTMKNHLEEIESTKKRITETTENIGKEEEEGEKEGEFFTKPVVQLEEFLLEVYKHKENIPDFVKRFHGESGSEKKSIEFSKGKSEIIVSSTQEVNGFLFLRLRIRESKFPPLYAILDERFHKRNLTILDFMLRSNLEFNGKEYPAKHFEFIHQLYTHQNYPNHKEDIERFVGVMLTAEAGGKKGQAKLLSYDSEHGSVRFKEGENVAINKNLMQYIVDNFPIDDKTKKQEEKRGFLEDIYAYSDINEYKKEHKKVELVGEAGKVKAKLMNFIDRNMDKPNLVFEVDNFPWLVTFFKDQSEDKSNKQLLEFVVNHAKKKRKLNFSIHEFVQLHNIYTTLHQRLWKLESNLLNGGMINAKIGGKVKQYPILKYETTGYVWLLSKRRVEITEERISAEIQNIEVNSRGYNPEVIVEYLKKYKTAEFERLKSSVTNRKVKGSKNSYVIDGLLLIRDVFYLHFANLPLHLWVKSDAKLIENALSLGEVRNLDKKMFQTFNVMSKTYDMDDPYHCARGPIRQKGTGIKQTFNENYLNSLSNKKIDWKAQGIPLFTKSEVNVLLNIRKYQSPVFISDKYFK